MLRVRPAIGTIDGINKVFNTISPYVVNTVRHILNGQLVDPSGIEDGLVENGGTQVTLRRAPKTGDSLTLMMDDGVVATELISVDTKTITFALQSQVLPIRMVATDSRPPVSFAFKDEDGSVINLIGATVRFKIRKKGTTTLTNPSTNIADLDNPTSGIAVYRWTAIDLPTSGDYEAQLSVLFPDGRTQTLSTVVTIAVTAMF